MFRFILVNFFFISYSFSQEIIIGVGGIDYNWKDYNGLIPLDAVPVLNSTGQQSYIGQVFYPDGIFVGLTVAGTDSIEIPMYNGWIFRSLNSSKILCSGYPDDFHWFSTNSSSNNTEFVQKYAVKGGFYKIKKYGPVLLESMYIGKIKHGKSWKLGMVDSLLERIYYPYERSFAINTLDSLEVLIYRAPESDYYWRNYYGKVPPDALPVEYNANVCSTKMTFIGKAPVLDLLRNRNYGVFPGQIFPEIPEVVVAAWGDVRRINRSMKILCTRRPQNFYWIPTNSSQLIAHHVNKSVDVIVGGVDIYYKNYYYRNEQDNYNNNANETLNVGRVYTGNSWRVGQISSNNRHDRIMFYPKPNANVADKRTISTKIFEALIYFK